MKTSIAIVAVAVSLAIGSIWYLKENAVKAQQIKLPSSLSELATSGKGYFEQNCMVCHGKNATGTKNGPPLVHIIYEPNHHSDRSFYRAVGKGVKSHHWPFGNMPSLPHVKEDEVTAIIKYVRELQQANGIF